MLGCSKNAPCPVGGSVDSNSSTNLNLVKRPAAIQLLDLDGQPFDLWLQSPSAIQTSQAITVVVFTRSDCPIANRFAPEISRLCEKYQPQGVNFFLVYVDPREQPTAIRRHLQEYNYPCAGLRDPLHTLVAHCEATTTPEAVVFNREKAIAYQGRISDFYAGLGQPRAEATTHDLAEAIKATVEGRPCDPPRTRAFGCVIGDLKN